MQTKWRLHYTTGCTTVFLKPGSYNRLYNVNLRIHGLTAGCMFGCKNQAF
jgi:hypothetical protein